MPNQYRRQRYARKARRIPYAQWKAKQRGKSRGGWNLAPIGAAIGSYFGGPVGGAIGGVAGMAANRLVSGISGRGAYQVTKNTLVHPQAVPQFVSHMTDGSIRIRHKEFIQDVVTSATIGAFKIESFPICASEVGAFPYLSQLAVNFEEFMFEGLVFTYIPSSGSLSTTGALGTVVLCTQYNSLSPPFSNKQAAEASTYSTSQVVSQACIHPIECDSKVTPSQGIFYNRRPDQIAGGDVRWNQLGTFSLITQGAPAASENVGELHVSYDVVLAKPILNQGSSGQADHYQATTGIAVAAGVGPYFGTDVAITDGSDGFTSLTSNTILIDPQFNGNLLVSYNVHGGAGAWVTPLMTAGTGVTNLLMLDNNVTQQYLHTGSAGSLTSSTEFFCSVRSTGVQSVITLSSGTFFTPDSMDLFVIQLPNELNT